MKNINLKDIYTTLYDHDCFCEVSDEINDFFNRCRKDEKAWLQQEWRYRAYFSLNRGDGIEHDCLRPSASPEEICIRKEVLTALYDAFQTLSPKQQERIYMYYFLKMNYAAIAEHENVRESAIRKSISIALDYLSKKLNFFD